MNIDFINPFLISLSNILETMAGIKCETGKPSLKKGTLSLGEVTGIIGMTEKSLRGSLAISFSKVAIIEIVEKMVGEITNMTTGGAKNLLVEKGFDFDMATPVVVSGKKHDITHKANGNIILIPLKTEKGEFYVELCFEKK